LEEKYGRFLAETNRDFIIFYAILLFTFVVGIIELLPVFDKKYFSFPFGISLLSLLYTGMLIGIIFCIWGCFGIYRASANLTRSSSLGNDLKKITEKYPTILDHFILSKWGAFIEAALIFSIIYIFSALLVDKIWMLT